MNGNVIYTFARSYIHEIFLLENKAYSASSEGRETHENIRNKNDCESSYA